jgi:hypothetical protein
MNLPDVTERKEWIRRQNTRDQSNPAHFSVNEADERPHWEWFAAMKTATKPRLRPAPVLFRHSRAEN